MVPEFCLFVENGLSYGGLESVFSAHLPRDPAIYALLPILHGTR
jgi:hypothetical protein